MTQACDLGAHPPLKKLACELRAHPPLKKKKKIDCLFKNSKARVLNIYEPILK
jgi:hypothetical protein